MNGEDVGQKIQYIASKLKAARNNALSLVNTPNFRELQNLWIYFLLNNSIDTQATN
jgi:hypothetical protein